MRQIATVSDRPDLVPVVARWRAEAFRSDTSDAVVEKMTALILAPRVGPEEVFVLFDGDRPVGTAALVHSDMDARPDLTPWLAWVFVEPASRGCGHATVLVRHVEAFAQAAAVPVLWLYTSTAEPLYAGLGWDRVGTEVERGDEVALMRRILTTVS